MKNNLSVDNSISHEHAKYQLQILCILGFTKMTNCGSKYSYFQISKFYQILLFLCSSKYKVFPDFVTVGTEQNFLIKIEQHSNDQQRKDDYGRTYLERR